LFLKALTPAALPGQKIFPLVIFRKVPFQKAIYLQVLTCFFRYINEFAAKPLGTLSVLSLRSTSRVTPPADCLLLATLIFSYALQFLPDRFPAGQPRFATLLPQHFSQLQVLPADQKVLE